MLDASPVGWRYPGRSRGIDVLRGIAIFAVLGLHLLAAGAGTSPASAVEGFAFAVAERGMKGVTLFFAISGFVITRAILTREGDLSRVSCADFYLRRVARIQPLFLATVAAGIAFLLLAPASDLRRIIFDRGAEFTTLFWASLPTFTFNWVRISAANIADPQHGWGIHWDILWSLAVEEQFYLVLPWLLVLCGQRRRAVTVLVGIVALSTVVRIVTIALYPTTYSIWQFSSSWNAGTLAAGVVAALVADYTPSRFSGWLIGAGAALVAAGYFVRDTIDAPNLMAAGAAAICCASIGSRHFSNLLWRPLILLGEVSYEAYLLHPLVLYFAFPVLVRMPIPIGWATFAAIAGAAGYAVHRGFTEPTNRYLRARWLGRQADQPVTP